MNPTLKQRWEKLKNDMKPMTFRQKVDHLWTYYYWVLIVLAIVVMLVCIVTSSVKNLRTEVLLSGVLVNADVSLEGHDVLERYYFEKLGGIADKQEIQLTDVIFEDPNTTQNIEYTYNATMKVVAMMSAKSVDYMIMDKLSLKYYLGQDMFIDLNELFSEAELEKWKDDLIYLTYEDDGITVPVAINIRNTEFGKKYLSTEEDHYIAFAANTPRADACILFWEYLKTVE